MKREISHLRRLYVADLSKEEKELLEANIPREKVKLAESSGRHTSCCSPTKD
jgi:hypothetical protein